MTDLTEARRLAEEARERAEKATEGTFNIDRWWNLSIKTYGPAPIATEPLSDDVTFIAAARSDVPSLAGLVLSLADEVDRLRRAYEGANDELRTAYERAWKDEVEEPI